MNEAADWFDRALANSPPNARVTMAGTLARHPQRRIAAGSSGDDLTFPS